VKSSNTAKMQHMRRSSSNRYFWQLVICLALGLAVYWPLYLGEYAAAIYLYGFTIGVYLLIQAATRFRNPLHGVMIVCVLAPIAFFIGSCLVAIGRMGR
jgi:hypothetical protein